MKKLLLLSALLSVSVAGFGEIWKSAALNIRNDGSAGRAVVYAGDNPVEIVTFSADDSQVVCTLHRFKNIESKTLSVRATVAANFKFIEHETDGGVDLSEITSVAPSAKETQQWIKKFKNAVEQRDGNAVCRLYFSKKDGTNPDVEINTSDGFRKMSDLVRQMFSTSKKVEILSEITFLRGKNFTMICGKRGRIEISVDGAPAWFMPIFIYKKNTSGAIETL